MPHRSPEQSTPTALLRVFLSAPARRGVTMNWQGQRRMNDFARVPRQTPGPHVISAKPGPGSASWRALRMVLKALCSRRYGLRCVSIAVETRERGGRMTGSVLPVPAVGRRFAPAVHRRSRGREDKFRNSRIWVESEKTRMNRAAVSSGDASAGPTRWRTRGSVPDHGNQIKEGPQGGGEAVGDSRQGLLSPRDPFAFSLDFSSVFSFGGLETSRVARMYSSYPA